MPDESPTLNESTSIAVTEENEAEILVVTFDDEQAAQDAVRVLNQALRDNRQTIYQGALLSRAADDTLRIRDLREMGLGDLITGTAGLTIDTGRAGLKLTWAAVSTGVAVVVGGFRLARDTVGRAGGLAGSMLSIPSRRRLDRFDPDEQVQQRGEGLEAGKTAVVILANHETAAELATDLVRSGGRIG